MLLGCTVSPYKKVDMGRVLLFGAAIIAALVFLPGLLAGGKDGAGRAGQDARDSVVDTAKDPQAVVDAAGKVTEPVMEVATPWWEWLIAQPWFYAAVLCLAGAIVSRRWWMGMSSGARQIAVGVFVAVFILVAIGLNR